MPEVMPVEPVVPTLLRECFVPKPEPVEPRPAEFVVVAAVPGALLREKRPPRDLVS